MNNRHVALVLFSVFLALTGFPVIGWCSVAQSTEVSVVAPTYVEPASVDVEGYTPNYMALNTDAIMDLIESILPLLITLAIIGAIFAAIGKLTRKF